MKKDRSYLLSPNPMALILGYVYLIVYEFALAEVLAWLLTKLGVELDTIKGYTTLQLSYMLTNLVAVVLIFRRFLLASLRDMNGKIKRTIIAVLLGFALHLVINWQITMIYALFELQPVNINQETVDLLLEENTWQMLLCTILLAPIVEELLFRGLFFAPLYRKSPVLAYVVSSLLFAAIHVVVGIGTLPVKDILLAMVQYLPAGIALGFVYQRTGNIFGPILLHMVVNFLASVASLGM